jgi:phage virion morphogenesis protein
MMSIEVHSDPVLRLLNRIYRQLHDTGDVMEHIRASLESRVSERFEFERDPMGKAWDDWRKDKDKVKRYPRDGNMRLLDRYSDMLGSLESEADADSVRIGFGQTYAAFHEFGTARMPRRGLLFADPEAGTLSQSDEEMVVAIIRKYLRGATGS